MNLQYSRSLASSPGVYCSAKIKAPIFPLGARSQLASFASNISFSREVMFSALTFGFRGTEGKPRTVQAVSGLSNAMRFPSWQTGASACIRRTVRDAFLAPCNTIYLACLLYRPCRMPLTHLSMTLGSRIVQPFFLPHIAGIALFSFARALKRGLDPVDELL